MFEVSLRSLEPIPDVAGTSFPVSLPIGKHRRQQPVYSTIDPMLQGAPPVLEAAFVILDFNAVCHHNPGLTSRHHSSSREAAEAVKY
jgi:hypothetical protein